MKDGFTLIEVVILFVIFITVAILVIPLSVEDAISAKNIARWKHEQSSFASIPISMMDSENYKTKGEIDIQDFMAALVKIHPLKNVIKYKIKYMNGELPEEKYTFEEIYNTDNGATIAFKWFDDGAVNGEDKLYGMIMYDVNGKRGPNVWGKDVFGMNVYSNKIEPFGKNQEPIAIEADCSRQGTGVYASYYYLNGGHE
ncbi:MAG: type II secretion system GspH family protein [Candidatus Gastranaerophilales bacterium]|nr:type II secretion system GspH family protein [Candidatus Gastranaerophilales bacterium]